MTGELEFGGCWTGWNSEAITGRETRSGIYTTDDRPASITGYYRGSQRYHPCTHPQTSDICLIGGHYVTNPSIIIRLPTAKGIFALENNGYLTELIPNASHAIGSSHRTLSSMGLR